MNNSPAPQPGASPWRSLAFLCSSLALATAQPPPAAPAFRFADINDKSLGLWEGDQPVLVYNHGALLKPGVPANRARSSYFHPIYGLDGEVLSDDFPQDHYHHRGLFWAWPHVQIDGQEHSLWDLRGIEQRFVTWLRKTAGPDAAVLGLENGWFVGTNRVMREEVWVRVLPATRQGRALDLELIWRPLGHPVTFTGAADKSYGGLTLRYAPGADLVITTPLGNGKEDLAVTRLKWADLSARFAGAAAPSGASIFIAPDHPDYPPTWLTRHYGVLCVGWPGVQPKTFPADQAIRCRYRVWIHRGAPDKGTLEKAYEAYVTAPDPWRR